LLFLRLTKQQQ